MTAPFVNRRHWPIEIAASPWEVRLHFDEVEADFLSRRSAGFPIGGPIRNGHCGGAELRAEDDTVVIEPGGVIAGIGTEFVGVVAGKGILERQIPVDIGAVDMNAQAQQRLLVEVVHVGREQLHRVQAAGFQFHDPLADPVRGGR